MRVSASEEAARALPAQRREFEGSALIEKGVKYMLALEEITRKLTPYKAKLIEMGDSL